jgi:DNA-binding response OmpR family regulator
MKILIVEDDIDMRQALQLVLEDRGHTVCWAAGGLDALALMRREPLDVVLLDLNLGDGIDGWEVMRRKTRDLSIQAIPVIVTTGEPARTLEVLNPLAGAILVMPKPIRMDRLDRALAMLSAHAAKPAGPVGPGEPDGFVGA